MLPNLNLLPDPGSVPESPCGRQLAPRTNPSVSHQTNSSAATVGGWGSISQDTPPLRVVTTSSRSPRRCATACAPGGLPAPRAQRVSGRVKEGAQVDGMNKGDERERG